jgi:hypothetical protein
LKLFIVSKRLREWVWGIGPELISVAVTVRFAGNLEHDLTISLASHVGEEDVRRVPDTKRALPPYFALSHVPHGGSSKKVDTGIVRPLDVVDLGTIQLVVATVIEVVVVAHQANVMGPQERLLGPLNIGLISSVGSQSGSKVEEGAVGDGVFVVVTYNELISTRT